MLTTGVLAALSGWFVRGVQFDADTGPAPQSTPRIEGSRASERVVSLSVDLPVVQAGSHRGSRNLFAYQEPPVRSAPPAVYVPPPVIVAAPVASSQPQAEERPRLRFTHRFIGRFGPGGRPIAAFARDGQVITKRVGERIDEHFVLRSIGVESVEVEAVVGGEIQRERVALGTAL